MATSNGVLHEPLLPRGDNEKKACVAVRGFATWVLALLMWAAFLAWVLVLVVFPTVGLRQGTRSSGSSGSSIYGLNGEVLLVFAAPVFFVAVLATIYLEIKPKSTQKKKPQARPRISLWTYPVLVDGLLGVVSAAELLFIIAFISYLVWAITNYVIKDSNLVKRFMEIPLIKTRFMLWQLWTYILGLRVGILGLICMSFLFLPVARGSPLLRLIDIPFEHAVKYHVWLGHLTMALFTFHGLCYIVVWTSQGRLIEELLAWQKFEVANLPGVISLVAGLALWMTSFGYVRLGSFELFFYTHQLYLVFVVFMAFHIGDFSFCICLAGIFLYMLDRFLRFCQSRRAVTALSWRLLPCGTIELLLPKPHCLNYNSLSFIFLNLPNVSWLQWHPFSVSSSPYDACDNISFLIKPLGSWTEKLQKVVKEAASTDSVTSKRGCPLGIEGPYGHESDYYLKYEALVLVAGGIGVSPFVAILRDLLHRYNMNHPNLPREVTLIWAVKSFAELNMINLVQPAIICPDYASRLNLTVQAYVTRESEPDPENAVPCTPDHILTCARMPSQSPMSSLVGTYSNIWMATYVTVSIAGFFIVQGLMQKFYLGSTAMPENEYNSSMVSWTIRAGVLLMSMLSGMVLFGGLVIFCWNWIESSRKLSKDKASTPLTELETPEVPTSMESLVGTSNTHYGQRPDLKELFDGFAKKWTGLDVGVLVCGPTTLQTSVAAECKFHNTVNLKAREIAFHYHSMIDDQDLGFFANFLGICIFVLVVAYHYVVADPKYEATS